MWMKIFATPSSNDTSIIVAILVLQYQSTLIFNTSANEDMDNLNIQLQVPAQLCLIA